MKLSEWRGTWPEEAPDIYVAVDPGETTGLAVWDRAVPEEIGLYELDFFGVAGELSSLLYAHNDLAVFTERFDIGNETVRVNPPMDSLYINGWLATNHGPGSYTEVGRADAKSFTSNAKLRHYGWWERGSKDHCRDAARVLAFAMAHFQEPWLLDKMSSYIIKELRKDTENAED